MGGDLWVRAATGTALVAVTLGAIWLGPVTYTALLSLLVLLGCREFESAWRRIRPMSSFVSRWLLSLVVLVLPAFAMLWMAGIGEGYDPLIPMGWFALTWTNDTGAYLAGRSFGRHKLAPQISPGKTWEGALGGAALTFLMGAWLQWHWGFEAGILCAAMVALFGPLGDLAESLLKRKAGIKDSGQILPGHGGVLDRFDSHFFAAPIAALVLMFF